MSLVETSLLNATHKNNLNEKYSNNQISKRVKVRGIERIKIVYLNFMVKGVFYRH